MPGCTASIDATTAAGPALTMYSARKVAKAVTKRGVRDFCSGSVEGVGDGGGGGWGGRSRWEHAPLGKPGVGG